MGGVRVVGLAVPATLCGFNCLCVSSVFYYPGSGELEPLHYGALPLPECTEWCVCYLEDKMNSFLRLVLVSIFGDFIRKVLFQSID